MSLETSSVTAMVQLLACLGAFMVLAVAAVAKVASAGQGAHDSGATGWLHAVTSSASFAGLEMWLAVLMLPLGLGLTQVGAAAFVALTTLGGLIAMGTGWMSRCNCFGSLESAPTSLKLAAKLLVMVGSGSIVLGWLTEQKIAVSLLDQPVLLCAIVSLPLVMFRLFADRLAVATSRASQAGAGGPGRLDAGIALGRDASASMITLGDLPRTGHAIVLGLRSDCKSCKAIVDDVARTVACVGSLTQVVVCSDDKSYLARFDGSTALRLHDETADVADRLPVGAYPFAMLVRMDTLEAAPLIAHDYAGFSQLLAAALVAAHNQGLLTPRPSVA